MGGERRVEDMALMTTIKKKSCIKDCVGLCVMRVKEPLSVYYEPVLCRGTLHGTVQCTIFFFGFFGFLLAKW